MSDTVRIWDIGDPEPEGVQSVVSKEFEDDDDLPFRFNRTTDGDWKCYQAGDKSYLDWADVVRRFGPVEEQKQ